jgi:predicted permease
MTKVLADALVPIFAGLLLGYFAGLWHRMDNQNVRTLISFVMSFAIPCSLFLAIASTPRAALREQAAAGLALSSGRITIARFGFRFASHGHGGHISRNRLHHCFSDYPGNS